MQAAFKSYQWDDFKKTKVYQFGAHELEFVLSTVVQS